MVSNTQRAKLYVMYPGDEILMIYGDYPYEAPQPILINPETGLLWLKLKIVASKKNWKPLLPNYASEICDKEIYCPFSGCCFINRRSKKFSLCLNSKSMREKREGERGKTQ